MMAKQEGRGWKEAEEEIQHKEGEEGDMAGEGFAILSTLT